MAELIPVAQAARLREALTEYLGTTFSLADPATRAALEDFLTTADGGMFRGPYVRLRLPFRPAADGWRDTLEWYEGFTPYGHQARAFARLSSHGLADGERPQPTLVTTGTGSGKTEAFLYPILDHVLRAKRRGVAGTKAIVLYPMNALAKDQADRLARLITSHPALGEVTAALYVGLDGPERSRVSEDSLITSRPVIRDSAPDIILTNYKMLDQLLLRHHDAPLWEQSAQSLQYLVLDEFHTYDGAQGTDVAMLIRRLGLTLAAHGAPTHPERPLGNVTPVATSATLGGAPTERAPDPDSGLASDLDPGVDPDPDPALDPVAMRTFAATVFGEEFGPDAVITEDRLTTTEWAAGATYSVADHGFTPVPLDTLTFTHLHSPGDPAAGEDPAATARAVLAALYQDGDGHCPDLTGAPEALLLDLVKAHPATARLIEAAHEARDLTELAHAVVPRGAATTRAEARATAPDALTLLLTALSHVRAVCGRGALSVDTHLWIRELTRVDRAATGSPAFSWSDDGVATQEQEAAAFPALYCRHCHRSGWGVALAPTGSTLDGEDEDIRRRHLARDDRFRPLLHAPEEDARSLESDRPVDNLMWFRVADRQLVATRPDAAAMDAGDALPVLTHRSQDAGELSVKDTCPSCLQPDAIRFLGSAIATMLSVTLSALFGTENLDDAEKKALVFTDSVQDAAHRAGFVQARSHTLTLRAVLRQALGAHGVGGEGGGESGELSLDDLVRAVLEVAGDDPQRRYRILPPDLADLEVFAPFWRTDASSRDRKNARKRVEKRLALDVQLEFGLRSGVGRTLATTGAATAGVDIEAALLDRVAIQALESAGGAGTLEAFTPTVPQLRAWVRGVLERMRTRGAIGHEWFTRFRREDGNRFRIWGGRPRHEGMPAFPRGASAPGYPRIGGQAAAKDSDMDPIGSPRGWYATWTAAALGVAAPEGAALVKSLFTALERRDVIGAEVSDTQATTYHLSPASITVRAITRDDLAAGRAALTCTTCHDVTPALPDVVTQLDGAPCLVQRCDGRLEPHRDGDNFYRRMYASSDMRRVIAREHTSLLPDEQRTAYEQAFKSSASAPDAPNVLVATPTLEMGIDIGDLSAVMLASLPRSVANYIQRIGRAGRLTGNSLAIAFVTARGDQLPRFADPLATVNGQVRPPATYLGAEEILRRQYLASVADVLARTPDASHPRTVTDALGSSAPDSYLGALIAEAEAHADVHLAAFLGAFGAHLTPEVAGLLREWATPSSTPAEGPAGADTSTGYVAGSSALTARCHEASAQWLRRRDTLELRKKAIQDALPALRQVAESPAATEEAKRELRTAVAALALANKQLADLRGDYWVSALEEYGLLPNYTLLDDTVRLGVSVSWVNPDTQEFSRDALTIERASAHALRDFAPGSTFYARGYAIAIDAVDLGRDGEEVRTCAICPNCGYGVDLPDAQTQISACPRCAQSGIADVRQRLEVVDLKEVSSEIRRDEATINDSRDERDRTGYQILLTTGHTPGQVRRRWYVDGYGFGAKYVRDMPLTWLNLGPRSARGGTLTIGSREISASRFRLCDSCGKRDTSSGRNSAREHRPWCPRRKEPTEHTRDVVLRRTLRTEGILMRLPSSVTMGDQFALPSLRAALQLALREHLGGAPDHLDVATVTETDGDGSAGEALLLHDIVPGGTGYLAELADADTVWGMLRRAWLVVRDCPCQGEDKLACERCLLPFALTHEIAVTSRAAAERHLRTILLSGEGAVEPAGPEAPGVPETRAWQLTQAEPGRSDGESQLEQRFRQVLRERLQTMGATVREVPNQYGNSWTIHLGGVTWRLEPQQFVQDSRPDFVLTAGRPGIPPVAIFTDGWFYHASPTHNRVADDAAKRENLRLAGYQVLSLSWRDVAGAEDAEGAGAGVSDGAGSSGGAGAGSVSPGWFEPSVVSDLMAEGAPLTTAMVDLVSRSGLDHLLAWMQAPDADQRRTLAQWVPMLALGRAFDGLTAAEQPLARVALGMLDGAALPAQEGDLMTFGWRRGTLALAFRVRASEEGFAEIAVVLDDREEVLSEAARDDWREWLHVANLLNHRESPTTITTRSAVEAGAVDRVAATEPVESAPAEVPEAWAELADDALPEDSAMLRALAPLAAEGFAAPELGQDVELAGDQVPVDLFWREERVAVLREPDEELRVDLVQAGWVVVEADMASIDVTSVRTALAHAAGSRDGEQ